MNAPTGSVKPHPRRGDKAWGAIVAGALVWLVGVSGSARADWLDSAWSYRQKVTVLSTVTDSDLTDFPYLVSITDAGNPVFSRAQADGDDLVFTSADGTTRLDHEIEAFDPSGTLYAWVEVPTLASATNTELYLYYGNAVVGSQESVAATWSNGYVSVYHLHDDFLDSASSNHGSNDGTADASPAKVADGQEWTYSDGADDIEIGEFSVSGSGLTVEAWIYPKDFTITEPRVLSKAKEGSINLQDHVFMLSTYTGTVNDNRLRFRLKSGTDDAAGTDVLYGSAPNGYLPAEDDWYHVAGVYDGTSMSIVRDGLDGGSQAKTGALRENDWPVTIGANRSVTTRAWDGTIDEVRVSSVARSLEWLEATYRNQYTPGTYETFGAEEIELKLSKRAYLLDGTAISSGAVLPTGTLVRFLIYIDNHGDAVYDVSMQDTLDPGFTYVSGSIRVDGSRTACADAACTQAEEDAIYAAAIAGLVGTDAVDGDPVSYSSGTVYGGNAVVGNAQVDIPADHVSAIVFTVRVE